MNQAPEDNVQDPECLPPLEPGGSGATIRVCLFLLFFAAQAFFAWLTVYKPKPEPAPAISEQEWAEMQRAAHAGETGPALRTLFGVESEQNPPPDSVRDGEDGSAHRLPPRIRSTP